MDPLHDIEKFETSPAQIRRKFNLPDDNNYNSDGQLMVLLMFQEC